MNFKKHRILIIGGSIALVCLIGAGFLLVQLSSRYSDTAKALVKTQSRLTSLNHRDPYPSQDNVEILQDNLVVMREEVADLKTRLSAANVEVEKIEPAQFAPLLERTYNRIKQRAASLNVPVPGQGTYGYTEYAQGKLPEKRHVERLVRQAKIQEYLAGLLLDAKVSSIEMIQRTSFEGEAEPEDQPANQRFARTPTPTRSANRSAIPETEPSPLYETERYSLTFTGREGAIWEAINQLSASPLFVKVVDVSLKNLGENLGKPVDLKAMYMETRRAVNPANPAMRTGTGELTPDILATIPREERIVAGREAIEAKLVIDVLLFKPVAESADGATDQEVSS